MAWMVWFVLILFYVAGRSGFAKADLIGYLPYVAGVVMVFDYVVAHQLRRGQRKS